MLKQFSREQVSKILKIKNGRLKYWDRLNLVKPSLRQGGKVFYDFQDLICLRTVKNIIEKSVTIDDFDFKETANDTTVTPKFKVTLGIMPDYLYDGKGLRIGGITKNKSANNSGILKGDIIIQLGEIEVTDIYKYMEGLSQYNTGDSTLVKVKRQDEILEFLIIF